MKSISQRLLRDRWSLLRLLDSQTTSASCVLQIQSRQHVHRTSQTPTKDVNGTSLNPTEDVETAPQKPAEYLYWPPQTLKEDLPSIPPTHSETVDGTPERPMDQAHTKNVDETSETKFFRFVEDRVHPKGNIEKWPERPIVSPYEQDRIKALLERATLLEAKARQTRATQEAFAAKEALAAQETSHLQASLSKAAKWQGSKAIAGFRPVFLRDSCLCSRCRDTSSKQKLFQTTDIPENIKVRSVRGLPDGGVSIRWENDIRGYGYDHVSTFSQEFFDHHANNHSVYHNTLDPSEFRRSWNAAEIKKNLGSIQYSEYMSDEYTLYKALFYLNLHGLLIIKGVPNNEKAVEEIGGRLGTLRDTFYGRTWDVKSVPEAKNVAYTHQYLGLHMDLLYMANPPGFQLLHCLRNTCQGGTSLFSDSFYAADSLPIHDFHVLSNSVYKIPYHYNNDGQHYRFKHQIIEAAKPVRGSNRGKIKNINYSPPFQAPFELSKRSNPDWLEGLLPSFRRFAKLVEDPRNLFQYRLKPGECVIFNNRRVLHGRTAFDAEGGERWLKGAYVDTDVFDSRWRVLHKRFRMQNPKAVLGDMGSPPVAPILIETEEELERKLNYLKAAGDELQQRLKYLKSTQSGNETES